MLLMGKSTINVPFSIAMLVYQRVTGAISYATGADLPSSGASRGSTAPAYEISTITAFFQRATLQGFA